MWVVREPRSIGTHEGAGNLKSPWSQWRGCRKETGQALSFLTAKISANPERKKETQVKQERPRKDSRMNIEMLLRTSLHGGICKHGKECQNLWKSQTCLLFHRHWRSVEPLCYQKQNGGVKLEELEHPAAPPLLVASLHHQRKWDGPAKEVGGTSVCTSPWFTLMCKLK